jgi:hypothetical protein
MKKRAKKYKANQGISNAAVKEKLNAALARLGDGRWVKGKLVKNKES